MEKILIVEDNKDIRENLHDFLKHEGFRVCKTGRGDDALEIFTKEQPDAVILDLNLPGLDGLKVCQQIRHMSPVPIIMLTARRDENDQLQGLEDGADDYITKPFSPKVLVLKVKKILKKSNEENKIIRFLDLEIGLDNHTVYHVDTKGKKTLVHLTPLEFNLLKTLALSPHKAFSRDQLLDKIYDDFIPPDIFDRTIDSHIKNLRKKLGSSSYIQTVRGIGYKATTEDLV